MAKKHSAPICLHLIFGFMLSFVSSAYVLATDVSQNSEQNSPAPHNLQRKLKEKRHTISYKKRSKRIPFVILYKPNLISIPEDLKLPRGVRLEEDGLLNLDNLTPDSLRHFKKNDLRKLIQVLAEIPAKISWIDRQAHRHKFKKKDVVWIDNLNPENAASALALKIGVFSMHTGARFANKLFANIISSYPEAILPIFTEETCLLLGRKTTSYALMHMLHMMTEENTNQVALMSSELVRIFLCAAALEDQEKLKSSLDELIDRTVKNLNEHDYKPEEKYKGILLGSILSGAMHYAESITAHDQKKIFIFNTVSNLVWATTTFIGLAPIASTAIAATGGGISLAAVISAAIYSDVKGPRNYIPDIKKIQGIFETAILEKTASMTTKNKMKTVLFLQWMRAAVHVNGLAD